MAELKNQSSSSSTAASSAPSDAPAPNGSGSSASALRTPVPPPPLSEPRSLPPAFQHQMETRFGADFSDVRVFEDHSATLAGATAFTNGNNIHFAPGSYDPWSPTGSKLIGHELAHVVQQRGGRVKP